MVTRSISLVCCALGLLACSPGLDPMPADGSMIDGGTDGSGATDAHAPCNAACAGATPHCLTSPAEMCVACRDDGDCSGVTPRCEPTSHACVACVASADCTSPSLARCASAHACVACASSADCAHLAASPACEPTSGACVGCLTNADCDASHACNTTTNTCVGFTPMSASPCGACLRDAECQSGQLCLPMTYLGTHVGTFCAWRQDASGSGAPNGACAAVAPYANTVAATSVDGTTAMVCGLRSTTCTALNDFLTGGTSGTGQCAGPTTGVIDDPSCGAPGVADGFCRIDSGASHFCTVGCTTMADCPCNGGACASHFPCASGFCSLNP